MGPRGPRASPTSDQRRSNNPRLFCRFQNVVRLVSVCRPTDEVIIEKAGAVVGKAAGVIADVLRNKLKTVSDALESLTRFGSENEEEMKEKTKLLYDFWSLERAIKEIK